MLFQPRMLEPSKPRPSLKISSVSSRMGQLKCCQVPKVSTNLMSTILAPLFLANSITLLGVLMDVVCLVSFLFSLLFAAAGAGAASESGSRTAWRRQIRFDFDSGLKLSGLPRVIALLAVLGQVQPGGFDFREDPQSDGRVDQEAMTMVPTMARPRSEPYGLELLEHQGLEQRSVTCVAQGWLPDCHWPRSGPRSPVSRAPRFRRRHGRRRYPGRHHSRTRTFTFQQEEPGDQPGGEADRHRPSGVTNPQAGVMTTSPATAPEQKAKHARACRETIHSACGPDERSDGGGQGGGGEGIGGDAVRGHRAAGVETHTSPPRACRCPPCTGPCCAGAWVPCRSRSACPGSGRGSSADQPEVICTTVPPAKSMALMPAAWAFPSAIHEPIDPPNHVRHAGNKPETSTRVMKTQNGRELHALGNGADDQSRGDDGEHQLVHRKDVMRHPGRIIAVRTRIDPVQKRKPEAAQEPGAAVKDQAVAGRRTRGSSPTRR